MKRVVVGVHSLVVLVLISLVLLPVGIAIEGPSYDTVDFCGGDELRSCGDGPVIPRLPCSITSLYSGFPDVETDCVCPIDYSDGANTPVCLPGDGGWDHDCEYASEDADAVGCADGVDNDGDGDIDCQDSECAGYTNGLGEICCGSAISDCTDKNDVCTDTITHGVVCDSACPGVGSYADGDCTGLRLCYDDCIDKLYGSYCVENAFT